MATDYTLSDLTKLTGVSPRTVRYYISAGLLPAPSGAGPGSRYGEVHLDRLRLIKKLQSAHLPLAEIRRRLDAIPEDRLASVADATPAYEAPDSALDYINDVLGRGAAAPPVQSSASPPAPAKSLPSMPAPEPPRESERAQWERISLDPDVELHVRRPLSRLQNKRVERLISIARQLLEED